MKKTMISLSASLLLTTCAFGDLKQEYKAKIVSGEIDPIEVSFAKFKSMNSGSGVDLKQQYKSKIASGEIDPIEVSFSQFKASFKEGSSEPSSSPALNQSDVQDHNNEVMPSPQTSNDVEEAITQYLSKKRLNTGLQRHGKHKGKGKYIVYNIATVTKDVNDKRFRDSVAIAYEKAYMGAQKQLLMDIYGDTISEKAMSLFENNSEGVKEDFTKKLQDAKSAAEKIDTVMGKITKLAEVKLDKELKKEGVSPSKLKSLSIKQKQALYKDEFTKTVGQKFTLETLLGSVPMQTFIGMYNGAPAVGVIMMKSDKTSQVAQDISLQRKPRVTKSKGKSPFDLLPKDDKGYLKEFGVRLFFDEDGMPAIISYSQKGVVVAGQRKNRIAKKIQSAQRAAGMRADAQISEFLNVVMSATDKETNGEKDQTVLQNQLNSVTGEEEIAKVTTNKVINILQETAKASSKMKNAGTSTFHKWVTKDKIGNTVVGSVSLWTYEQLGAAKRIQTGKDVNYGKSSKEKKAMKEAFVNTQGGRDVMDVDDF